MANFTTAGVCRAPLGEAERTLLSNVLMPADSGYTRADILLAHGKIAHIGQPRAPLPPSLEAPQPLTIDCTERMVLPGFVNAHTHSVEHWSHGLIKPLPLELWVQQLLRHEPRGVDGWYGPDSFGKVPADMIKISAILCGVESMLSGCSAVLDHLFVRNLDDMAAAVEGYKAVGVRAFIAPMLGDESRQYDNYIPKVPDGAERNRKCARRCSCAMGPGGAFREMADAMYSEERTKAALELWEEAVKRFHDPEGGIEVVIGPVTAYSASPELLRGASELRKKYNLCGHTHLLETRAQALMAKQYFKSGSAVKHLHEAGFLALRGTSCAHTVWLDDEEFALMAETGASCVHNPLSNLRLGSGVMPVKKMLDAGVNVAMGTDGSCSSDGQDMIEAIKVATILAPVTTPEYREWPHGRQTVLTLAAKNGYEAIGMKGVGGELKVGMVADVTLWDLTSMALLPRTDPISLLALGSRTQAPGAGSTLNSAWIRGVRTIEEGEPRGVDLKALRKSLMSGQEEYRDQELTNPAKYPETAAAEVEYRAAMGLPPDDPAFGQVNPTDPKFGTFEEGRVLYPSTIE